MYKYKFIGLNHSILWDVSLDKAPLDKVFLKSDFPHLCVVCKWSKLTILVTIWWPYYIELI